MPPIQKTQWGRGQHIRAQKLSQHKQVRYFLQNIVQKHSVDINAYLHKNQKLKTIITERKK